MLSSVHANINVCTDADPAPKRYQQLADEMMETTTMSQYAKKDVFYSILDLIIITVDGGCGDGGVEKKIKCDARNYKICMRESVPSRFETHDRKDFHLQVRLCCPEIVYPRRPRP